MPKKCSVRNCRTGYDTTKKHDKLDEKMRIYPFPKDQKYLQAWLAKMPYLNKVTKFMGVCSKHWPPGALFLKFGRQLKPLQPPSIFEEHEYAQSSTAAEISQFVERESRPHCSSENAVSMSTVQTWSTPQSSPRSENLDLIVEETAEAEVLNSIFETEQIPQSSAARIVKSNDATQLNLSPVETESNFQAPSNDETLQQSTPLELLSTLEESPSSGSAVKPQPPDSPPIGAPRSKTKKPIIKKERKKKRKPYTVKGAIVQMQREIRPKPTWFKPTQADYERAQCGSIDAFSSLKYSEFVEKFIQITSNASPSNSKLNFVNNNHCIFVSNQRVGSVYNFTVFFTFLLSSDNKVWQVHIEAYRGVKLLHFSSAPDGFVNDWCQLAEVLREVCDKDPVDKKSSFLHRQIQLLNSRTKRKMQFSKKDFRLASIWFKKSNVLYKTLLNYLTLPSSENALNSMSDEGEEPLFPYMDGQGSDLQDELRPDDPVSCLQTSSDVSTLIPVMTMAPNNKIDITYAKPMTMQGQNVDEINFGDFFSMDKSMKPKSRSHIIWEKKGYKKRKGLDILELGQDLSHENLEYKEIITRNVDFEMMNFVQGISKEKVSESGQHISDEEVDDMDFDNEHEEKRHKLDVSFEEQQYAESIRKLNCRKLTTRKRWSCEICHEVVDSISLCFDIKVRSHLSTHLYYDQKQNDVRLINARFDQTNTTKMSEFHKEPSLNSITSEMLGSFLLGNGIERESSQNEILQEAINLSDASKPDVTALPYIINNLKADSPLRSLLSNNTKYFKKMTNETREQTVASSYQTTSAPTLATPNVEIKTDEIYFGSSPVKFHEPGENCKENTYGTATVESNDKNENRDFVWHCSLCDIGFIRYKEVSLHATKMHGNIAKYFQGKVLKEKKVKDKKSVKKEKGTGRKKKSDQEPKDKNTRKFCEVCGKRYNSTKSLTYHLMLHKNKEAFRCSICQLNFSNPTSLDKHKRRHGQGRPVICDICGKVVQYYSLRQHMKIKHKDHIVKKKGTGEFLCTKCPRKFDTISALNLHDTLSHDPSNSRMRLNAAEGDERTTEELKADQIRKKTCEICSRVFDTVKKKTQHMNVHLGLKPYPCMHCPRKFATELSLRQHQVVHQERIWECDVCDKKFKAKRHLQSHYSIHTGEKPYSCSICGRNFRLQFDMYAHFKRHTEEEKKSVMYNMGNSPATSSSKSMDMCLDLTPLPPKNKKYNKTPYERTGGGKAAYERPVGKAAYERIDQTPSVFPCQAPSSMTAAPLINTDISYFGRRPEHHSTNSMDMCLDLTPLPPKNTKYGKAIYETTEPTAAFTCQSTSSVTAAPLVNTEMRYMGLAPLSPRVNTNVPNFGRPEQIFMSNPDQLHQYHFTHHFQ